MTGEGFGANGPRLPDAFGFTADPSGYVPRLSLEAALAELTEVIGKSPACAALSGEAGLGKTLLLHVLRERLLGAFESLYVPFPRLAAPELWRWTAVALGLGSGADDRGAVLGRARRLQAEGSGLVLLIDDAGALPPSTRSELLGALDTPGFSLVMAFNSEDYAQLGVLPAQVRRVELGPPMTLAETRAYVLARLRRAEPEGRLASRLTPGQLASLHEASGGVPARLHALLDAWFRPTDEPLALAVLEAEEAAVVAAPAHPVAAEAPIEAAPRVAGRAEAARPLLPVLPERLLVWVERLRKPGVRLAIFALFLLVTLGAWLFALQRSPGVASVGVPVQRLEASRPEPVLEPAVSEPALEPAVSAPPSVEAEPAEPTPAGEEVTESPPLEAVTPAEADAPPATSEPAPPVDATPVSTAPPPPAALAAHRSAARPLTTRRPAARSLAPPLPSVPPTPDPNKPEPTVNVSSPRFPDEHVPPLLEPRPLAPPPSGPRLSVNARPWAEISLDGKPVGETPLGELSIAPGAHTLSAKLPDGRVVERSVEARAGDVYVVFP